MKRLPCGLLAIALLGTACGGSSSATPASPAPAAAPQAPAEAAAPAAAATAEASAKPAAKGEAAEKYRKAAERAAWLRANYDKREVRIPMRDGVELYTIVYSPRDTSKTYPFLMQRTPYSVGPYGDDFRAALGPARSFEEEGFIFVFQDVRGRFMSGGEFDNMRPHIENKADGQTDESTDTYDTIEWLLANVPNNNGKVGQYGTSYPGFYTAAGMIDSHPALAAVSPQAPIADWFFDDFHRQGAFILPMAFNFFSVFGVVRDGPHSEWPERLDHGTDDGYRFFLELGPLSNVNDKYLKGKIPFWNDLAAHPNYDQFWKRRNLLPHLEGIKAAVMVVGGWYDTEDLYGPPRIYAATEANNPGISNQLVMGPWTHGMWHRGDGDKLGAIEFGAKTSEYFREQVELPFFLHHLKGAAQPQLPEALVFETGANRWRGFDAWPPKAAAARSLYLREGGELSFDAPTANGKRAADSYVSDPAKPVPYTAEITANWAKKYMIEDQRFAAWRPDVLVYESAVLTEDVTLAGPIEVELFAETTGGDSDFIVKLVDVHPGRSEKAVAAFEKKQAEGRDKAVKLAEAVARERGEDPAAAGAAAGRAFDRYNKRNRVTDPLSHFQELVRAEAFRGRFREGFDRPKRFRRGKVEKLTFKLWDQLHTFKKGHRIMVQVQSTWFPFVDRNPQSWVENIFDAKESDFIPVTNTIHRSRRYPSRLKVQVLPEGEVPGEVAVPGPIKP